MVHEVRVDQVGRQKDHEAQAVQVDQVVPKEAQEAEVVRGDQVEEVAQQDREELVAQPKAKVDHQSNLVTTNNSI